MQDHVSEFLSYPVCIQVEEMIRYVKKSFRESLLSENWIEEDMKVALVKKVM